MSARVTKILSASMMCLVLWTSSDVLAASTEDAGGAPSSISHLLTQAGSKAHNLYQQAVRIRELGSDLSHKAIRIEDKIQDWVGASILNLRQTQPRRFDVTTTKIKRQIGNGRVYLRQYANGHWLLFVAGTPYIVRGIIYQPTPVGRTPDDGTLIAHRDWMFSDLNHNGKPDGPYDAWVDKNRNDIEDADEKPVGDFQLLKDMGVNTIRLYHHGFNKALLYDLYKSYGIRVMMGDYVGMYGIGSGATWKAGTDYSNPIQQKKC